jgi:hypothetical protein
MPRSTLRQYAVSVACVLTLGLTSLTACSSDSASPAPLDPTPSDTSSASESPTTSTSPDASPGGSGTEAGPPVLPPEARGTTRASAIPFVSHWIAVLNYGFQTLNAKPLQHLSAENCSQCAAITRGLRRVKTSGGHIEGGTWTARQLRVVGDVEVQAVITYPSQVVFERKGAKPEHFKPGRTFYVFGLSANNGRWTMKTIEGGS